MSELVCVAFPDPDTADQALNKLQSMQKEYLLELEDACVVVRDADGKVHLKQAVQLVKPAAIGGAGFGALWGTMIGLLFLNPLAGLRQRHECRCDERRRSGGRAAGRPRRGATGAATVLGNARPRAGLRQHARILDAGKPGVAPGEFAVLPVVQLSHSDVFALSA